jgi:Protein of unknown function (DUF3551)
MKSDAQNSPRRIGLALGAMVAVAMLMASCSTAYDDPQAWCSVSSLTGSTQCFYRTKEQCMATISGLGGLCQPNMEYTGQTPKSPRSRLRQR